ncbi:ketol-acid reductoisomerase [Vulcanisaeta souniana]|uniref:Ketol-acid reductoisomerase (NADP(+)) n=1 Tax=Vulcanisaeta souniana JCM 11219 TaxID=1293586 RepID=A0A830E531_9CREN|nr:ketol-acid reductoisomerase [Vulcanisaeta souniana]BDR92524.1 ketol-acid reductoisomerase [Vulcanisaeta souniana JCM 11219]GGI83150.1 ketol-acid reductoisomerase [Vulcanisaeta souniana JCM 11219]
MAKIYKDRDADLSVLSGKVVAVLGYGIQGRSWALNTRDSGIKVIVGVRPGKSLELARQEGFEVYPVGEAVKKADVIAVLLPDMVQPSVWMEEIAPNLKRGTTVVFAHGFNVRFGLIKPPNNVDVVLIAPKAPGKAVRDEYVRGWGVPALVAVHQNFTGNALKTALALAKANGFTRTGVIETTFAEETETDLIGEQNVLVGGLLQLLRYGFEVMVELGYQPEVAYFEAINEAKLIMDLIWERGLTGMLLGVSETARYGGLTVGPYVINEDVKRRMKEAAERVRNGEFAKEWVNEYQGGAQKLRRLLEQVQNSQVERVGDELRKLMRGK